MGGWGGGGGGTKPSGMGIGIQSLWGDSTIIKLRSPCIGKAYTRESKREHIHVCTTGMAENCDLCEHLSHYLLCLFLAPQCQPVPSACA